MEPVTKTIMATEQGDWAHAPPLESGVEPHGLDQHLQAVGEMARALARNDGKSLAQLAGVWHDLGKRRDGFQRYIRQASGHDAHIEHIADRDKTHSAAGALWALRHLRDTAGQRGVLLARVLQHVIAGHHAGLDNGEGGLSTRLAGADALREAAKALARPSPDSLLRPTMELPELGSTPIRNEHDSGQPGRFALWVRMVLDVPRSFADYQVTVDEARVPSGVQLIRRLG